MLQLEIPVNEKKRLERLRQYDILDTPGDGNFDRITALASTIFKVPIAIISLVDHDRIWFKSHHGLPINQINRDPGLCASAILTDDTYVIENAVEDPRTLANPLVAGDFGLRFYAAAPLQTDDNYNLGTLCIIDKAPRVFTTEEKVILKQLAAIVMDEMEMRIALRNTVSKILHITNDVALHLKSTIDSVKTLTPTDQNQRLISYLEASHMFLSNTESELNSL